MTQAEPSALPDEPIELGGHPLFPRPETEVGPDPRRFDLIQIVRILPDKTREVCPTAWKGSELRSWQQIIDMYGGECWYQLNAMCGKSHKYTAKSEMLYFAGPARKPFVQEPQAPRPAPAASPINPAAVPPYYYAPPAPAPAPAPAAAPAMGVEFMGLLKVVLETMRSILENTKQPAPPPPQGNQTLEVVQAIAPLLQQPPQSNSLELVRELVPLLRGNDAGKPSVGAGYERGMERGIELAKALGGNGGSGGDEFGEIAKLLTLVKSTTAANSPPPPPPPPPPPQANPWPTGAPMSWEGWEMIQTPMGIIMRQTAAPAQPAPAQPAPVAPAPEPVELAQLEPVAPVRVQSAAPMRCSDGVPNVAPPPRPPPPPPPPPVPSFVSAPLPPPAPPPPPPPPANARPEPRTHKSANLAPHLTAAGLVPAPSDPPPPADPLGGAVAQGIQLLGNNPDLFAKLKELASTGFSPEAFGEVLVMAEKGGAK
ncbi:hypothetical protein [Polyangium sp. y55x31]|uniref:hypothetical protein n=1 Tax=Polyangium sp. y55x31 TaxID=3042688 RepID=UPI002482A142|nr:hypothetical protein [Polyangium sp. y55x31]MDI1484360.1 hypothetical protein [Polyangium sp. y55x31]